MKLKSLLGVGGVTRRQADNSVELAQPTFDYLLPGPIAHISSHVVSITFPDK